MIEQQKNAKLFYKVGGKAFPKDYNWKCPKCQNDCRWFEETCSYCEWETKADIVIMR